MHCLTGANYCLAPVKQCTETFGGRHAIAFFHQIGDLIPVKFDVKPDADPAMMTDVRRHKESFGIGTYQYILHSCSTLSSFMRHAGCHSECSEESLVAQSDSSLHSE